MENLTICKVLSALAVLILLTIFFYWNSLSTLSTGFIALYIEQDNQSTTTTIQTVTSSPVLAGRFRTVDSHLWIINKKLLQISTIISRTSNESNSSIEIETHIVHDKLFIPREKPSIKCLVVRESPLDNKIEWIVLDVDRLKYSESNGDMVLIMGNVVWKFDTQWSQIDLGSLYTALIDEKKYPNIRISLDEYQTELLLHKPRVIKRFQQKIKSSINCVHTLRDLNPSMEINIKNWLKIQKLIGVDMVSLCLIDYENKYMHQLEAKSDRFIEINEYIVKPEILCDRLNLNSSFCDSSYLPKVPMSLHEKICDCACLLYHKHHYQYVSNYDVDDLILPRLHSTNLATSQPIESQDLKNNCSSVFTKLLVNYTRPSLPQYLARLEKSHAGKPIGCFIFDHYLALHNQDLFENLSDNQNGSQIVISYKFAETSTFLEYWAPKSELPRFKNLVQSFKLNKCVRESKLMSENLNIEWKRGIKSLLANRYGKSIGNTDHFYSFNPHSCSMFHNKDAIQKLRVPVNEGFVSHMRHQDTYTTGAGNRVATLTYGIFSLTVDLEYLYFLINNKREFDSN